MPGSNTILGCVCTSALFVKIFLKIICMVSVCLDIANEIMGLVNGLIRKHLDNQHF